MSEQKFQGYGTTKKSDPIVLVLPSRINVFCRPQLYLFSPERIQIIQVKLGLNKGIVYEFKPITLFVEQKTPMFNWDTQNLNPYSHKYFNRVAIIGWVDIANKVYFRLLWREDEFDLTQNVSR